MIRSSMLRSVLVGAMALACAGIAVPASAQLTSLIRGKVIDEAGKPVPDVAVHGEFTGDKKLEFDVKTDKNGGFVRAGLAPGPWKLTATKDKLVGSEPVTLSLDPASVTIKLGDAKATPAAGMTQKQVEENNKKQAAAEADFNAAKTAFEAGDYQGAIDNLNKIIANIPDCFGCYQSIGDANVKLNKLDEAEKAYLKVIEIDPTKPAPYASLATVYNSQKKFDEAAKMSAKANELSEGAGGTGDASARFNQGVILWNQSKAAEAEVQFQKASELDPKMADAFYWLGMCRVNQGKLPAAKEPFQTYMKLAPTGQYADQVKSMLELIK